MTKKLRTLRLSIYQHVLIKKNKCIQEFLDSGGDTKPSEYLKSKALSNQKSKSIKGEITLTELNNNYNNNNNWFIF